MVSMKLEDAQQLAQARLRDLEAASGPLEILEAETRQTEKGWLFFYNSAAFIRSGSFLDALAGNGPLLVGDDGSVQALTTAIPWEEQIAA